MFGLYRFLLALIVLLAHLWTSFPTCISVFSVWSFYIMSGYLITHVLNERYRYRIWAFAASRFVRLYPPYLCMLAATGALLYFYPVTEGVLNRVMLLPDTWQHWAANIAVFGIGKWLPYGHGTMITSIIIPPAWSLNVELVFYLMLAAGLAYYPRLLILMLCAGIAYLVYSLKTGISWANLYFSITSGIVPFSLGALVYYYKKRYPMHSLSYGQAAGIIAVCWATAVVNALYFNVLPRDFFGVYFSLITSFISLVAVVLCRSPAPAWLARLDRWGANYSYGLFLSHFLAGAICLILMRDVDGDTALKSGALVVPGGLLALLIAMALHRYIEKPLMGLRKTFRSAGRFTSPQPESVLQPYRG